MGLWIRSQDKMKLVKVNYCYIMDQQGHFTIIGETIDSGPIVGIYATKERALEILDEIQNCITGYTAIDTITWGDEVLPYEIPPTNFYQMPKE